MYMLHMHVIYTCMYMCMYVCNVYIYTVFYLLKKGIKKKVHNQKRLCNAGIGVFRRAVWLCHSRPTTFFGCAAWLCRFRSNLVVYTSSAHNLTDRALILAIMRRKPVRTTSAHNQPAQPARTTSAHNRAHNQRTQPTLHNQRWLASQTFF